MKRFPKILIAVITCFCVLTVTYAPVFATGLNEEEYYIDSQGYIFTYDEYGYPIYNSPVYLYDNVYPYPSGISFFSGVDGSSALDLSYIIEEELPNLRLVESGQALAGGAAAAGGGGLAAGTVAKIAGLSTGQIVLFSFLASAGILLLVHPDLVKTTINDIFSYIDYETQLALGNIYVQETWVMDEEIANAVNEAIGNFISHSDGVVWNSVLSIPTSDLTGVSDTTPETNILIEYDGADVLSIEYSQLPLDTWVTIDSNKNILYRHRREGEFSRDGKQYASDTGQSVSNRQTITALNVSTGVEVKFYYGDNSRYVVHPLYNSSYKYFIGEPVYVNDSGQVSMEIVFGFKKSSSSFYSFSGLVSYGNGIDEQHPLIMSGTGSVIDDKLITDVSYNSNTGNYVYTYKDYGTESSAEKTVELKYEPFYWLYSCSQADTNPDSSGALNTNITKTELDEYGKIETSTIVEVPQLKPMEIPKPNVEVSTETDPDTGEVIEKETVIVGGASSDADTGADSDLGLSLDPADTANPDEKSFTGRISAVFNLKHLFDWLPERYSSLFDSVISVVGSLILVMVIWSIAKRFFPLL